MKSERMTVVSGENGACGGDGIGDWAWMKWNREKEGVVMESSARWENGKEGMNIENEMARGRVEESCWDRDGVAEWEEGHGD